MSMLLGTSFWFPHGLADHKSANRLPLHFFHRCISRKVKSREAGIHTIDTGRNFLRFFFSSTLLPHAQHSNKWNKTHPLPRPIFDENNFLILLSKCTLSQSHFTIKLYYWYLKKSDSIFSFFSKMNFLLFIVSSLQAQTDSHTCYRRQFPLLSRGQ